MTERKRPIGRPSLYRPEYCERVLEMGMEGYSIAQMAATLGVDKASVYRWRDENADFRTALSKAMTAAQAWWERLGLEGMQNNKQFNALVWKISMQARFREDYTERKVQEITGANGGAIEMQAKRIDVSVLDPDQREQLKQLLLEATKGKAEDE